LADTEQGRGKGGILKRLYDWVLAQAERRYAVWALLLVAVSESVFFPVPPDALLVPMGLSRPRRALLFSLVATLGSVGGGALGYLIGCFLREPVALPLIQKLGMTETFGKVSAWYREYAAFAVAAAAFSPIPYKVFTIAAGVCGVNFILFILVSLIFRGARFFIEGALLLKFGDKARVFIEKHLVLIAILCLAVVAVIIWLTA